MKYNFVSLRLYKSNIARQANLHEILRWFVHATSCIYTTTKAHMYIVIHFSKYPYYLHLLISVDKLSKNQLRLAEFVILTIGKAKFI